MAVKKGKENFEERARQFSSTLESLVYREEIDLTAEYSPSSRSVPFSERGKNPLKPIRAGTVWGRDWESAWFHLQGVVPSSWKGSFVVARLNFGCEACVFDNSGTPLQGLSVGSIFGKDFIRERFDLFDSAAGGETVDLWVEAAANDLFGLHVDKNPDPDDPNRFGSFSARIEHMTLAVFDREIWHLSIDTRVLYQLMMGLPEGSVRRERILRSLLKAIDHFGNGQSEKKGCQRILHETLDIPSGSSDLSTVAVGHAHIDTAWLWPVRETRKKCGRTFSSQIRLMEKYREYTFGASAAQHYDFVKQDYPELYEKITRKIAEERWEIQGAMWVEADCNLTGGESLVRQILYGKNFFRDEFKVNVQNLWIPDVFGYTPSLPQILKNSGVEYFVTQKMSWSQFNLFPHHTFRWRGIDGSEVVTHFPPEDTYNSKLLPLGLITGRENFSEKDRIDEFLTLFGYGDGGGGPTEEHIEAGIRQKDLEGCPRVKFGHAQDMLERIGAQKEELRVWSGELYLEYHRGTLTSQARSKRWNRKCEHALREVEFLFSCLPLEDYPGSLLRGLWKTLLLNQFHDVLPGSSIHMVYEESLNEYREMGRSIEELREKAGGQLFSIDEDRITLVNTLSCVYDDPVRLPKEWEGYRIATVSGDRVPTQTEEGQTVVRPIVAPLSHRTLVKGEAQHRESNSKKGKADSMTPISLENELMRYEFSDDGTLDSAFDKERQRAVLSGSGKANVLSLYHDLPLEHEAWDVEIFYENQRIETASLLDRRKIADGDVRVGWEFIFTIGGSRIKQRVYLANGSRRLDFETAVEWRERRKMLRVSFDVAIQSDYATFDIQFGHKKVPTHRNTSWEIAKFEVAAHRFVDLSESDYGVALLNDCKYGYKVMGNRLDLNLLRSPVYPDADADLGDHSFTYSFLPHPGAMTESNVLDEAAKLNQGICVFGGRDGDSFHPPVSLQGNGIVLETLKKAEKDNALIVRTYESRGCQGAAELILNREGLELYESDLMEWESHRLPVDENSASLVFRPFQIRTFMVRWR